MTKSAHILCIGAVHWDVIGRSAAQVRIGADVPGRIMRLPGGVAMNIAMTLRRFGMVPALLTAVGRDAEGDGLVAEAVRLGMETAYIHRSDDLPTDAYMAIEGPDGLVAAIADAHSLEAAGDEILSPLADGRLGSAAAPYAGLIALDGNLTPVLLHEIAHAPLFVAADLRIAPASPAKAARLLPLLGHAGATFYVNLAEAGLLCQTVFDTSASAAAGLIARGARRVLVTDGARSVTEASRDAIVTKTPPAVPVKRVTGAGDTFMAAHIASEWQGHAPPAALAQALAAAASHVSGETP